MGGALAKPTNLNYSLMGSTAFHPSYIQRKRLLDFITLHVKEAWKGLSGKNMKDRSLLHLWEKDRMRGI